MKASQPKKQRSWLYKNSLSVFFISIFLFTLLAQAVTGWHEHNSELSDLGGNEIAFSTYICSGHFISATFENFESEFLQMTLYVLLTIQLRQIGSAESKKIDESEEVDREPVPHKDSPWPVKKGGWVLWLYSHSLSIVFALLFFASWVLHLYGSWQSNNVELQLKGKPAESLANYVTEANFWFETFQNWQSEFLSVASIVILSIFLREKGSPESKPVDAPHLETGK